MWSRPVRWGDVIELRGRLKTFEIVSAALTLVDEDRTVFAAPDTGLPIYVSRVLNNGPVPREIVSNFLTSPTSSFDLLTLLYKAREAGGSGTFPLLENGESSTLNFQSGSAEKVKTYAGDFDTTVSTVEGPFIESHGFKNFKINFSTDEYRIPVLIRFKTTSGNYRIELSGIQQLVNEKDPAVVPTPSPTPKPTPKPTPTPLVYVPNQPLLPEVGFALGESLEYKVTSANQPIATVVLAAKERSLYQSLDALKLTATVTGIEQGNKTFALGDSVIARVNPDTLVPYQVTSKFGGALSSFNQSAKFDPKTGAITFGTNSTAEGPLGTHCMLSLLYAMRSFNLSPSKDPGNPANDTRVAVFWSDRTYIFTLRPTNVDMVVPGGAKIPTQMVTINTGNPQLDQLGLKVWLSVDGRRLPLRFSAGTFQFDLNTAQPTLFN